MMVILPLLLLINLSTVFTYPLESLEVISSNIEKNISLLNIYQRYNFRSTDIDYLITNITNIFMYKEKKINEEEKTISYADVTVLSMFDMLVSININMTSNIILNRTKITAESYYSSLLFKQNESLSISYTLSPSNIEKFHLLEWDLVQYTYFEIIYSTYWKHIADSLENSFKDVLNQAIADYPISIAEYYFKRLIQNIESHKYYDFELVGEKEQVHLKLTNIKYKANNVIQLSMYQFQVNNVKMKAHLFSEIKKVIDVKVNETEYGMSKMVLREINVSHKLDVRLDALIKNIFYKEYYVQIRLNPFDANVIDNDQNYYNDNDYATLIVNDTLNIS